MKKFTYIIFSCLFISCAQSDVKPVDETIERLAKDFTSHLAGDWEEYSVTRYFSRSDSKFSFLASNFGEEVVNQASRIEEARLNVKEKGDVEGGYDLGILVIEYDAYDLANRHMNAINASQLKNLKRKKVFVGFRTKLCGSKIVFIYSVAVATAEISSFFNQFSSQDCQAI